MARVKHGALEFVANGRVEDIVLLLQEVTALGREFGDLLIEDEEASAEHCQIRKIGDCYHVVDLSSTNGTFLNEKKVLKAKLAEGDMLRIGLVNLRFVEVFLGSEADPKEVLTNLIQSLAKPAGKGARVLEQIEEIRNRVLGKAKLVLDVIYEDGGRQEIKFEKGIAELGRLTERGKFKDDHELSKLHATIKVIQRGEVVVRDQGSTNGTFVNEQRLVGECTVVPGDVVHIGRTRIWCRLEV